MFPRRVVAPGPIPGVVGHGRSRSTRAPRQPRPNAAGVTWLRGAFALSLLLPSLASALDRDAYREDLIALMQVVADIRMRVGAAAPGPNVDLEHGVRVYASLTDPQIDALDANLPAIRLQALVGETRRLMREPPSSGKQAVVVEPDVTPEACASYPPPVVLAALATKHVADHVIKALEFECQQSTLGVNVALGCEAPEIAATTADIASTLADFCGGQQSAATNTAVLANERSIARHLDRQLDVELSTRATQSSLDVVQAGVDGAIDTTTDTRTRLDDDTALIASRIEDALQELAALTATVTELHSRGDELVFQARVSQALIEGIELDAAQLQALGGELVAAAESRRDDVAEFGPRAGTLAPAIVDAARTERRDALAAALGAPELRVATYALPLAAGGHLEEAREVLIEAILALQALGQGDTAQALVRLAAGDIAYNQQRYADAWREFAAAYRGLDPHAAGATP